MYRILLFAAALIVFGVIMRMVPHAPNMTPIAALAFTASIYLGARYAIAVPLIALTITDLCIGSYDLRIMASVYLSFALVGLVAMAARTYRTAAATGMLVIAGSVLFFLITNGAVWLFSPWYAKSIGGLLYAYELGIPFFRNMLIGDIFYTALLVMVVEVARLSVDVLAASRRTIIDIAR